MIFLDIETQNAFDEDGVFRIDALRISYVGVIDSEKGDELDFWESDLPKLKPILESADVIVGYNSISFDMPVLARYLGEQINQYPQIDLMVAAKEKIGFRPKLNNLTNATLGKGKLGSGLDAVKYWANQEIDKLKQYCMEDVRLTKEVYDYGKLNRRIKYYDRNGFLRETDIDWELGGKNLKRNDLVAQDDTISLF